MMNYKGYVGVVEYDDEAKIFSGEVINTRTVITFQGTTVDLFKDFILLSCKFHIVCSFFLFISVPL